MRRRRRQNQQARALGERLWIRMKDRLPEEHSLDKVLFYDAANRWFDVGVYRDEHFLTRSYVIPARYVTHWQPLDEPADLTEKENPSIDRKGGIVFTREKRPRAPRYVRRKQPDFQSFDLIDN